MCNNIDYNKCIQCHNYPALTTHKIETDADGTRIEYISCPFAGNGAFGGRKGWAFKNGKCELIANCQ